MKKTTLLILVLLLSASLYAQRPHGQGGPKPHKPFNVEAVVSDLSAVQKKKLESVTNDSKKRVDKLQAELKNVRQQIRTLMDKDGDNSAKLFPLLDREGVLQAEITKEMYNTRLLIDEILTPDQLKELRTKLAAERPKRPHHR